MFIKKFFYFNCIFFAAHAIANISTKNDTVQFTVSHGPQITEHRNNITNLYLEAWQEYPDLYKGSHQEYGSYLCSYEKSNFSIACIAWSDNKIIGAAIAIPLLEENALFVEPMRKSGLDLGKVFYLGVVVVAPSYRSSGIGSHLFQMILKEMQIHKDYTHCLLYTVEPAEEERIYQPTGYRPARIFWQKHGFSLLENYQFTTSWLSIVTNCTTQHQMTPLIRKI